MTPLAAPAAQKIFEAFDKNGDGTISKDECSAAFSKGQESKSVSLLEIASTVKNADTDSDGVITKAEWEKMFEDLIGRVGAPPQAAIVFAKDAVAKLNASN